MEARPFIPFFITQQPENVLIYLYIIMLQNKAVFVS